MQVHFINVGYGEAILITKDDFVILIDGGTNRREEYNNPGCIRVEEYIKRQCISKIDIVIITHMHDDHIGGIENVVNAFDVGEVWINVKPKVSPGDIGERFRELVKGNLSGTLFRNALNSYSHIVSECEKKGIPVTEKGSTSGKIFLEEGFSIEILSPDPHTQKDTAALFDSLFLEKDMEKAEKLFYDIDRNGNQTSIALRVEDGKTAVLLSGDKTHGWDEIYKRHKENLNSQILKITHHGQLDGMPEAMLSAAKPDHIVICASGDRRFNSAHPDVIKRANTFLKDNNKDGGVYVTGLLDRDAGCPDCFADSMSCNTGGQDRNAEEATGLTGIVFDCKGETGEISLCCTNPRIL